MVKRLHRKLGDATGSPAYILTEPRISYRMEKGEKQREWSPNGETLPKSSVPTHHATGIERPRCVDRLPSHISMTVVSTVCGGEP